jgi:hypothetical protein
MKKQLFLLFLTSLLLCCSSAYAQSKYYRKAEPKFGAGVKAGLNYANQSSSGETENTDIESIVGINGGIYCNYYLFDFLALQPELMVSGKGVHWRDPFYNAKDVLTYIDMPILIKYEPVKLINIHAGPQIGYLISAKQKNLDNGEEVNINDFYENFDLGLALGIEGNFPFRLSFTIRYVFGLTNVTNGTGFNIPWKNNVFQMSAVFRILGR